MHNGGDISFYILGIPWPPWAHERANESRHCVWPFGQNNHAVAQYEKGICMTYPDPLKKLVPRLHDGVISIWSEASCASDPEFPIE